MRAAYICDGLRTPHRALMRTPHARIGPTTMSHNSSSIAPTTLRRANLRRRRVRLGFGLAFVLAAAATLCSAPSGWAADDEPAAKTEQPAAKAPAKPDLSGRQRIGKASVYAQRLDGRKMADGTPMQMDSDSAASKTLPLGTKAKVTSLETGRSAVVTIRDRGPYVHGRILDVSPSTARKIGLGSKRGVAKVAVEPITVPLPDGGVKRGDGDT